MDIFGIGPIELLFIFLIALILLGPKEMEKAGRTIGRWLRNFVSSDTWHAFRDTSRELRNLPNRLMREANLEEMKHVTDDIKDSVDLRKERFGTWKNPASSASEPTPSSPAPDEPPEQTIAPPSQEPKEKDPHDNAQTA